MKRFHAGLALFFAAGFLIFCLRAGAQSMGGVIVSYPPRLIPAGATAAATFTIDGTDGNTPGLSIVNMTAGNTAISIPNGTIIATPGGAQFSLSAATGNVTLQSSGFDVNSGSITNAGAGNGGDVSLAAGKALRFLSTTQSSILNSSATAGNPAFVMNTLNTMNAGDLLLNLENNGVTQFSVSNNAVIITPGSVSLTGGASVGNGNVATFNQFAATGTSGVQFPCTGAATCKYSAASGQITLIGQSAPGTTGLAGGQTTVDTQIGGAGSGATAGGAGGNMNQNLGAGGAGGTTGNAGGGGAFSGTTGAGGAAGSSTGTAAAGGNYTELLGAGGAGSATLAAGAGGAFSFTAGNGGTNNGGGGGAGGGWTQDTGASTGAVAAPTWTLFNTNGGTGTIGRSGQVLNLGGNQLAMDGSGNLQVLTATSLATSTATGTLTVSGGSGASTLNLGTSTGTTNLRGAAGSVQVNGTALDQTFCVYNAGNLASATAFGETTLTSGATVDTGSKITQDVVGVGGGNFVVMVCTDGTTCAGGNQRLTYTEACTAAAGTRTAATVQNSGTITAGTVLTVSVTTACATTDPGANICIHYHY